MDGVGELGTVVATGPCSEHLLLQVGWETAGDCTTKVVGGSLR